MKTSLFTVTTIALLLTACGKENPFQEQCYQADSGAVACLRGDTARFQFMHQKSTERGFFDYTDKQINFTRTYFNTPLFDLAYEKFSCDYRKDGQDLYLKCSGSEHMVYQEGLQVHAKITPDGEEVLFKSHNPNFSGDALK